MEKKKLLWIGDAIAATGFSTVGHNVLDRLKDTWDVHMLGVAYYGDPHTYDYAIYPASVGGDLYGFGRLEVLLKVIKPDIICILNDAWIASRYITKIRSLDKDIPIVLYIPVDAVNLKYQYVNPLNQANVCIAYTQFGRKVLQTAGLSIPCAVIPHGVDTDMFKPVSKHEARDVLGLKDDIFIVLNVNRNQTRKRIDLFLYYFAEWINQYPHDDAYCYYHGCVKDDGWDIQQLATYFGIEDRLILTDDNLSPHTGIKREYLKHIYSMADVFFTPCGAEGWGLCTHEAMACATPVVLPEYSALAEWPKGGCHYVALDPMPIVTWNGLNTIHRVADKQSTIDALELLYQNKNYRNYLSDAAYLTATKSIYDWNNIASQFDKIFKSVIKENENG